MSGFFGSTFTSAKSDSRVATRVSVVTLYQCSPASSDRYNPSPRAELTVANILLGMLGAMVSPMRPRPSCSKVGRPVPNLAHVLPPSVERYNPLPGPENWPFSHGPWRDSQRAQKSVFGLDGSITT